MSRVLTLALVFCLGVESVLADEYPDEPLTMVVAFGVGGSADRLARTVAPFLAEELGQPVQVINKKGAGTLLGANFVLSRPDDGYTLFCSSFSPYLSNTILEGNAAYTIEDFAYLNFQWFDEDLIATPRGSKFTDLPALLDEIRTNPKTVRASVVRGSTGHLMIKLLLELQGIDQDALNLVTYNNGGAARAAVAGGVVDFTVISAKGSESIREFISPIAFNSSQRSEAWDAPTIQQALRGIVEVPVLPGSIRGFATTAKFRSQHPERFEKLELALKRALENEELQAVLARAEIGARWTGSEQLKEIMQETFNIFRSYSHLLSII